jgi:hypothetical protein
MSSAQKRRQARQHERLIRETRQKIRELILMGELVEQAAVTDWLRGDDKIARQHFDEGSTSSIKLETLVAMVGQDYTTFAVYYVLQKERAMMTELIELLAPDEEALEMFHHVVGGGIEELDEHLDDATARLMSVGYDVEALRTHFIELVQSRRSA